MPAAALLGVVIGSVLVGGAACAFALTRHVPAWLARTVFFRVPHDFLIPAPPASGASGESYRGTIASADPARGRGPLRGPAVLKSDRGVTVRIAEDGSSATVWADGAGHVPMWGRIDVEAQRDASRLVFRVMLAPFGAAPLVVLLGMLLALARAWVWAVPALLLGSALAVWILRSAFALRRRTEFDRAIGEAAWLAKQHVAGGTTERARIDDGSSEPSSTAQSIGPEETDRGRDGVAPRRSNEHGSDR